MAAEESKELGPTTGSTDLSRSQTEVDTVRPKDGRSETDTKQENLPDFEKMQDKDDTTPHDTRDVARVRSSGLSLARTATATEEPSFSLLQEIGFVFCICMAQLLTQASLAQTVAPLRYESETFRTSNPGQLSWLTAGYSLTVGTFILPAGRWGDLYGHRLVFAIGYAWFAVWSLVSGFAAFSHSLIFFAACRALQGIGPALLIPNGLAILGRTYPPGMRKNIVFSLFGATAPSGFVIGALFTSIFAEYVWWPWTFWVEGIVCGVCLISVFLVIPPTPVAGGRPKIAELDLWGTGLGVSGLVLFNFAWNQGPTVGWPTVYVYVLLIVGILLMAAFLWWDLKLAEFPLLPSSAFTSQTSLVLACIAAGWASFGIFMFYAWQLFDLRGQSPLQSTAQFVPVTIAGFIAAILTGFLLGSAGPGWVMLGAMCAFLTGNILLATVPVHQTFWAQTFVATIVTPFGMDMSFPAGSIILSDHMPRELQGIAASILCVIQNYWISIGLGMAGTVESQVSGGDALKGYRGAWYLAIGLDGLGIVCAVALVLLSRAHAKVEANSREKVPSQDA